MRYEVPNTKNKAVVALVILAILIAVFAFYVYPNEELVDGMITNFADLYRRDLNATLCN